MSKKRNCRKGFPCGLSCIAIQTKAGRPQICRSNLSELGETLAENYAQFISRTMSNVGDANMQPIGKPTGEKTELEQAMLSGKPLPDEPLQGISITEYTDLQDIYNNAQERRYANTIEQDKPIPAIDKFIGNGAMGYTYLDANGDLIKVSSIGTQGYGNDLLQTEENWLKEIDLQNKAADIGLAPRVTDWGREGDALWQKQEFLDGYMTLQSARASDDVSDNKIRELNGRTMELMQMLRANGINHLDLIQRPDSAFWVSSINSGNVMWNPETNDMKAIDFGFAETYIASVFDDEDLDDLADFDPEELSPEEREALMNV